MNTMSQVSTSRVRFRTSMIAVAILVANGSLVCAEDRDVLFEDNFDSRKSVKGDYYVGGGKDPDKAFPIVDGYINARQVSSDHGSTIRKMIDFRDIDIEIDFRFSGGTRFNFVLDDDKEKSVWAAHIARVSVSKGSVAVQDDKTGTMNLKIRKMRKDPKLSARKKKELEALLETKRSVGRMKFKNGQWYRLRILMKGDRLEAFIDGRSIAAVESPGISHPTKSKFGMTVNGDAIDFDNLKAYKVK